MSSMELRDRIGQVFGIVDRLVEQLRVFGVNEEEWTKTVELFRDIPVTEQRIMALRYRMEHALTVEAP